jgi:hypothetical protein
VGTRISRGGDADVAAAGGVSRGPGGGRVTVVVGVHHAQLAPQDLLPKL